MCSTPKGSPGLAKRRSAAGDYAPVFSPGTGALYGASVTQPKRRSSGDDDSVAATLRVRHEGTADKKSMWRRIKENLAMTLR